MCNRCGLMNAEAAILCLGCGEQLQQGAASSSHVDRLINEARPSVNAPLRQPAPTPQWTPPRPAVPIQPVYAPPPGFFGCPFCHSTYPPHVMQRIFSAGWVVFVVLLLTCLPLCWIGLLIKENYRVCASCRMLLP